MSNYTPTTQDVRDAWLTAEYDERDSTTSNDELRAGFDRWLALIIEGAEQRGAVNAGRANSR